MCNDELLVSYLYDDIAPADRERFESHLRGCATCRAEVESFRGLRSTLAEWTPPVPDLGFRIVRQAPAAARPAWRAWWTPAFGLAAAAVLVLAAASALAHVQLTRDANGWMLRTGWGSAPAVQATAAPAPALQPQPVAANTADMARLRADYVALERRLNDMEAASRKGTTRNASATSAPYSDAEIMRRVRDLLTQSESRQQRELAFRITQVIHDVDAQRVADLARIQQGFGRIDAMTTQEAAAHRDLANYILTSSRQK